MKITIVIPVYNTEKYLDQCIESVRGQRYQEWEIIAIDDGSTDASLEILKKYRELDSRITIHEQSNQGAGPARNYGIKNARGDYIAFLDSDDYWADERCLDKLVLFLEEKECPPIVGTYLLLEQDGVLSEHPVHKQYTTNINEGEQIDFKDEQEIFFYPSYMFKTSFLQENNIFFPSFRRYQDPPFLLNVMHIAQSFYVMPMEWYVYRVTEYHTKFNSRQTSDLFDALLYVARKAKENHYEKIVMKLKAYVTDESNILQGVAEGNIQLLVKLYSLMECLEIKQSEEPHFNVLTSIINDWIGKMKQYYEQRINLAEQILIYGAGIYGRRTFESLKKINVDKNVYFAVSKKTKEEYIDGIAVADILELDLDRENTLVLLANRNARIEMEKIANELGYENIITVDWIYKMIMW